MISQTNENKQCVTVVLWSAMTNMAQNHNNTFFCCWLGKSPNHSNTELLFFVFLVFHWDSRQRVSPPHTKESSKKQNKQKQTMCYNGFVIFQPNKQTKMFYYGSDDLRLHRSYLEASETFWLLDSQTITNSDSWVSYLSKRINEYLREGLQ